MFSMALQKQYYFFIFFFCLLALLQTACKKEYSCEGCRTIAIVHDTVAIVPPVIINKFPQCSLCKASDDLQFGKWNFKTGNSFLCGSVDGSGFIAAKTAFTFFGPSACSIDTGIVVTIYLPEPLDQDKYDIPIEHVAFYYYDHNAPKDIFISLHTAPFTATIQSFIYSTGIATGTFSGTVYKPNGDTAFVSDGRYKVKVR
jgi:hypothetical protein